MYQKLSYYIPLGSKTPPTYLKCSAHKSVTNYNWFARYSDSAVTDKASSGDSGLTNNTKPT